MERHLQTLKRLIFALIFELLIAGSLLSAQTPSVVRNIRLPLWAELDAYPGLELSSDENSGQFDFPVSQMRRIAPFIISGMVYGWNFVYVPYDKARGVEEYLEVTEIVSSDVIKGGIKYSSPWIENNNLNAASSGRLR